jgi:hypothetical protein
VDPTVTPPTGAAGIAVPQSAQAPRGPLRTYRPAKVARLSIRLEDFSNEDGSRAVSERNPFPPQQLRAQQELSAAQANLAVAQASGEAEPADFKRVKDAQRKVGTKNASRDVGPPDNASPDIFAVEMAVVPVESSLELNSFRIADKLQMTVALRDFPIVPDVVRAVLIDYYQGDIAADDFKDPSIWVPQLLATKRPMFRGYADVHDMSATDSDFTVQIQARSLEAVLMDAKVNPRTRDRMIKRNDSYVDPATNKIVRGEKLTRFVRRFISTIPEFSGELGGDAIGVRIWPNFDPSKEPVLGADMFLHSLQTAQSRALAGGQVQAAPPTGVTQDPSVAPGQGTAQLQPPIPGAETSAWDVIVRACELSGFLPVYDPSVIGIDSNGQTFYGSNNILLVLPQTLMETPQGGITLPGGAPDGFSRQFLEGGTHQVRSDVRFFVWGHNVKNLKFSRKHGRIKAPAVRVVCHDPDAPAGQRTLVSTYPKTMRGTRASARGTGAGGTTRGHPPIEELVTKVVHGIRTQVDLDRIAVALYHTISRQEVSCELETDDLQSYVDPAYPDALPDLLTLRPGTPVRVSVARKVEDPANGLQISELSEMFDRQANPAFMRKLLLESQGRRVGLSDEGRQKLSDALAQVEAAYDRARLTEWFYVRVANHKTGEDGWSGHFELVNFLEARSLPANLSAQDAAAADLDKLMKPVDGGPDPNDVATSANFDDAVDSLLKAQNLGGLL